jgi:hypothetical protein
MSLFTLSQIQFATNEELKELVNLLNKRGKIYMKVYLVLDNLGRPLEAFAYPEHAQEYMNSTLTPGLTVLEKTMWWSYLRSKEHDADRPSMP